MKRGLVFLAAVFLFGAILWAATPTNAGSPMAKAKGRPSVEVPLVKGQSLIRLLNSRFTKEYLAASGYVGSEFCLACHPNKADWRDSAHATMHASVADASHDMDPVTGIVFDYNDNGINDFKEGLNFNSIASVFDTYKPNAPILSFVEGEANPYRVTIGQITYTVFAKQGGYYQQRLITRIPVVDGAPDGLSRSWYEFPFAYSPRYKSYASYNPANWWGPGSTPKFVPGMTAAAVNAVGNSWTKRCVGCHVTGYSVALTASGEWAASAPPAVLYQENDPRLIDINMDGLPEWVGVGCESCHGPGSRHILGNGDPSKIINPSNLTRQQQVWLCAQCHTRGASKPGHLHDFAYDETNNKPYQVGETVWNYLDDAAGRWPDGKTPTKGEQQYQGHEASAHWTNPYHLVVCSDCHDPHSAERKLPNRENAGMATSFDNDTLCLSCHATHGPFADITTAQVADYSNNRTHIGEVVTAHSHHPYNPEGQFGLSNCVLCHMPHTAKRDYAYDECTHTMEAIAPEKTLNFQAQAGMPSSCTASCHAGRPLNYTPTAANDDFSKWNEVADVKTATILKKYFGPGGLWWNTTPGAPGKPAGKE